MAVTDIGALRDGWRTRQEEAPRPGNDTGQDAGRAAFSRLLDSGLGEVVRNKLGGQLSRASASARVLADQLSEAHTPVASEIVDAIGLTEGMLQDVLEFWQVGLGGGPRVERRRMDLRSLCERVVDSVQLRHPMYGLGLECNARIEGHWDPEAIAGLFTRIVLNAVHHGPTDGAVRVRLTGRGDCAVFEVRSSAPLSLDVPVHRLFEPFVCARKRRSDGETGLGLGLYLADQVARAHHGRIEVEDDKRAGVSFRVLLPIR